MLQPEQGKDCEETRNFTSSPLSDQTFGPLIGSIELSSFRLAFDSSKSSHERALDQWTQAHSWCVRALERVEQVSMGEREVYCKEALIAAKEICQISKEYFSDDVLIVSHSNILLIQALFLQKDCDPVKCEDLCLQVIKAKLPSGAESRELKGKAYTYLALLFSEYELPLDSQANAEQAIRVFSSSKEPINHAASELALAYFCRAKALLEKECFAEAETNLLAALGYCRDAGLGTAFKRNLLSLYLTQNQLGMARHLCKQIVDEMCHQTDASPNDLAILMAQLGNLNMCEERLGDARHYLGKALEHFHNNGAQFSRRALKTRLLMAVVLFQSGRISRAQRILSELAQWIDNDYRPHLRQIGFKAKYNLANCKLLVGNYLVETSVNLKMKAIPLWKDLIDERIADSTVKSIVKEVALQSKSPNELRRELRRRANVYLQDSFNLYMDLISYCEIPGSSERKELPVLLECAASCLRRINPSHCMIGQLEEQAAALRLEFE